MDSKSLWVDSKSPSFCLAKSKGLKDLEKLLSDSLRFGWEGWKFADGVDTTTITRTTTTYEETRTLKFPFEPASFSGFMLILGSLLQSALMVVVVFFVLLVIQQTWY